MVQRVREGKPVRLKPLITKVLQLNAGFMSLVDLLTVYWVNYRDPRPLFNSKDKNAKQPGEENDPKALLTFGKELNEYITLATT